MKLYRRNGATDMPDSGNSVVVGIDEPDAPVFRKAVATDSKTVILRSDIATACPGGGITPRELLFDAGLVVAAMPEAEFVCFSAHRQGQDLYAHTDTEQGFAYGEGMFDIFDGRFQGARVTGTIGNDNTVESHIEKIVIVRDANHIEAAFEQAAYDVHFYAAVDQDDRGSFVAYSIFLHVVGADEGGHASGVGVEVVDVLIVDDNLAQHAAFFAEAFGQGTRVDVGQTGNSLGCQPVRKTLDRAMMMKVATDFGYHYAADLGALRFKRNRESELVGLKCRDTVIADHGVGEHEDLSPVGWVAEALGITDHAGIEDNFTRGRLRLSKDGADKLGAVFEDQPACFGPSRRDLFWNWLGCSWLHRKFVMTFGIPLTEKSSETANICDVEDILSSVCPSIYKTNARIATDGEKLHSLRG